MLSFVVCDNNSLTDCLNLSFLRETDRWTENKLWWETLWLTGWSYKDTAETEQIQEQGQFLTNLSRVRYQSMIQYFYTVISGISFKSFQNKTKIFSNTVSNSVQCVRCLYWLHIHTWKCDDFTVKWFLKRDWMLEVEMNCSGSNINKTSGIRTNVSQIHPPFLMSHFKFLSLSTFIVKSMLTVTYGVSFNIADDFRYISEH